MTVKSISFGAPFAWLTASVESLRKDPAVLFRATALLLAVVMGPVVIHHFLLRAIQPISLGTSLAIQAVFMLYSVLVVPPVAGGYFRILHLREHGQPVSATDVFAMFHEPGAAKRMIATALIFTALYVVLFIAMYYATGVYLAEVLKIAAATPPGKPPEFPPPPNGFLAWCLAFGFAGLILMTALTLASIQVALGSRSPIEAVGDAFAATLRNFGAFFLFYVAMFFAFMLFVLIFGLLVGIVAFVLGHISPILMMIVLVPVYLGLVLVMYAVMFGFNYQAWRGTIGDGNAPFDQQIAA